MAKLPSPDDPLSTATVRMIRPTVAKTFKGIEVPSNSVAQRIVSSTRRKLADLPAVPKQLNSIAAILVYTASGLSDAEISVATGFTVDQIKHLRNHPAYTALESNVIEAARNDAQDRIRNMLADNEVKAVKRIVDLIDLDDPKIALAAAKDVLDRGGIRQKEVVDHRHQMDGAFVIEVVDQRNEPPTIDMRPV